MPDIAASYESLPGVGGTRPLSPVSLTELLRNVASEELSGEVEAVAEEAVKSVSIDRGHVVCAASSLKSDRLGETMMELGRISQDEFALASRLMKGRGQRFGQALITAGFISEDELSHQLSLQANRIVQSLFQVNEGSFSFKERVFPPSFEKNTNLSIPSILLESLRTYSDVSLILTDIPSAASQLRRHHRAHLDVGITELRPLEQFIMQSVSEGSALSSIVRAVAPHERESVLQSCYTLLGAGLLEIARPTAAPTSKKTTQRTIGLLDWVRRQRDDPHGAELRYLIQKMFTLRDRLREDELLEIGAGADREEIEKSYYERKQAWSHVQSLVADDVDLASKAREVQFYLAAACHRLLSIKESAQTSFARSSSAHLGEAQSLSDGGAEDRPAPHPPRLPSEGVEEEMGLVLVEEKRDELELAIDLGPDVPMNTDQRRTTARQLLRDAKIHLQVQDWKGAINLLSKLVDLEPSNGKYRGLLAKAMSKHPPTRRKAVGQFIHALRLAPRNADLHYSLGLCYQSFGMKGRAGAEFRAALEIEPRHQEARRHLMDGDCHQQTRGAVRTKLDRIFL